ncbi:MAG: aldehyde ferredoxin oxidoreductase [Chloroflexota bacterium]|nr:MAG: aldehyde ferredoxin oxidoreductase [Chloroflexota bacterium]
METWRVNLREQSLRREAVLPAWERLGGRSLIARILLDEVPPTCEPLGRFNKLIFAPGLLVGHMLTSLDRISVGAKSPLTGGVKEANAGGSTGMAMALLGMKALILEDLPDGNDGWLLVLGAGGARFEPAGELAGLGVYTAAARLLEHFGTGVAIALIGPGGEMRLASAGIQNLDKDGVPSRIAARGGLGAVMGSKHIKAIIFDPAGGEKPSLADPQAFREAQKALTQVVLGHPQTTVYQDYGTAAMSQMCNQIGGLPTRNFSSGMFEGVEGISGEHMRDLLLERGGESQTTHACMRGCSIRCSNTYAGPTGQAIVSPLEYETIGLLGSNLGIADLDVIARLNQEANDQGIDTIEMGAALGVAAEAGLFAFGDGEKALELLGEVRRGTPLGRILGSGAVLTGRILGVSRVPAVKGQAMSAYEPRAIKGTGVTYATSPQGADHTSGLTIRAKVNHLRPDGQVAVSRNAQLNNAGYDSLGACLFAGFGISTQPDIIRDLLNARYGWQVETGILQVLGRECLLAEREFNRRAGFTQADDRLPEWMCTEPLPPHQTVFDVPAEELDQLFDV